MGGRGASVGKSYSAVSFVMPGTGQKMSYTFINGKAYSGIGAQNFRPLKQKITEKQVRDSLKKQGISYKEYSSSQLKKRDKEYAAYRREVEKRKSTHALLNTGTTNRHGKSVKHRALSSGEDFNITFSQWRSNKKR